MEKVFNDENQTEKYYELEITPALEKYLLEVDEGKHLGNIYENVDELCDNVLGKNWRNQE